VAATPFRYQSPDEDSARWLGFPFREGDIVISARSKTGTTWVQMICALLIFQQPELPAPLAQLSPWLDHLIVPREQVYAGLAAQQSAGDLPDRPPRGTRHEQMGHPARVPPG
jgi:aryl sulfotransferase